jgi:hypothetical protein
VAAIHAGPWLSVHPRPLCRVSGQADFTGKRGFFNSHSGGPRPGAGQGDSSGRSGPERTAGQETLGSPAPFLGPCTQLRPDATPWGPWCGHSPAGSEPYHTATHVQSLRGLQTGLSMSPHRTPQAKETKAALDLASCCPGPRWTPWGPREAPQTQNQALLDELPLRPSQRTQSPGWGSPGTQDVPQRLILSSMLGGRPPPLPPTVN